MRVFRHTYSRELREAAERFLIDQFDGPTQYTEAQHLPDLIDAAMHIVTDAAWIQPDLQKDSLSDVPIGERGSDYGDEDDEED